MKKKQSKLMSMLLSLCLLMQLLSGAAVSAETILTVTLPDVSIRVGKDYTFNNVQDIISDDDTLFSLIYNSSHYDEHWVDRNQPLVLFSNLNTGEEYSFTQENSPLKCIDSGGWDSESGEHSYGIFDLSFEVPITLAGGMYNVTVELDVPSGKEGGGAHPIHFNIEQFYVMPLPGGSGGGGSVTVVDRSSVDSMYYDAAKVCYDLDLMNNVYTECEKIVTREDLAYALVNLGGFVDTAIAMQDEEIFSDLEVGTYLNGCAAALYHKGLLAGVSYGEFGSSLAATYGQIIKNFVDLLGYAPYAQNKGGYPYGYLSTANMIGLTSNVYAGVNGEITCQQLAQLIYNALEIKLLSIAEYTTSGPIYEVTDNTLLYKLGFEKYQGDVSYLSSANSCITIGGKLFNSDNRTGTEVVDISLEINDNDIYSYIDKGMKLYVKNNTVLSALKYYYAMFTINDGAATTDTADVNINFDTVGFTKYSINGGDYEYIQDSKSIKYTLPENCGQKTVAITFANDDESETKTFSKSITLKKYHTLRYMVDNAVYHTESVLCGAAIPAFTRIPYKESYVFEGWNGLPSAMPDYDLDVIATFTPEVTVFEATLPSQNGYPGETVVIEDIASLIPEHMQFGLSYASTQYEEYIMNDARFTFVNSTTSKTHIQSEVPLKAVSRRYNLEIPIPEDLEWGTYILTIELDIAQYKEDTSVKPYKFTIEEFIVGDNTGGEEISETVFAVADATTLAPISGAEIFISNEDGTMNETMMSDVDGNASFVLDNGIYNVQAIASGYEVRNFTIEITDEKKSFTIYMNKNSLITVESTVHEMTKDEMEEAGIDVDAAENKHIYKCIAVLKFVPVQEGGDVTITPIEINFDYYCDEEGTIIKAKTAYCDGKVIYPVAKDIFLIVHSEVTWLKEIFDVQLVVTNTSAVETINDLTATLDLPEGLSLAVMTDGQQSLQVEMPDISPLGASDTHWYICGDAAGEYNLSGVVTGTRTSGGISEKIQASFVTQDKISVLAGDAMNLLIEAEKYATAGQPYKIKYTLTNVSGKTLYDVALNVLGGKFCKAYSVSELIHNGELIDTDDLTGTFNNGYPLEVEEFRSGDILSGVFEITFGTGIDTDYVEYMVSEMFTFTGEGSTTTIPTEIRLIDNVTRQYVYKFVDEDGSIIESGTADLGASIPAPEAPLTDDPYVFDYWSGYTEGMTVTGDMTFTAVYKYKTYYVIAEGISFPATYGSDFSIDQEMPVAEEYIFKGYFTEENGQGTQITDENGRSLVPYKFKENIEVYPFIAHELLNKIKINGTDSTVIGDTDVVKKVYFATDKEAQYLLCTIKYPEVISLKEIIAKDFEVVSEESKEIADGYVYQNLICQYSNNLDTIPVNTKIAPFELIFDIPETVTPQTAEIEITADCLLIGNEDYSFDYIINGSLEIAAKPVENIEIIGSDTIILENGPVTYTAEITPEYATNKNISWSVDDDTVATISEDGVLTPLKKDTVTVIATATDGSMVFAEKTVTIMEYAKINSLKSNVGTWDKEFDPNIREYVIYVEEGTEKITFTPQFTSGTLKINNSLAVNNRGKSITLSGDDTDVILVRSNAAGYVDVNYVITVMTFKGTKTEISEDGIEFNIKPVNVETGHTVILALYNGDEFVGMQTAVYNGNDISFTTDRKYTSAKVMVWGDLSDLSPSCTAEKVK